MRMARASWSLVLAAAIALGSAPQTAAAQMSISVAQGDGACPLGSQPLSLGDAQREQGRICGMLGEWFIARLAGGGSIDGRGYGCQIRASDPRTLGHTICGNYVIGIPTPPPPPPAIDPSVVPGTYDGVHPHWRDSVTISPDGTYRRGNGDSGTWRIEGITLVLQWASWGPERLDRQADGSFRASTGFTLVRRGIVPPRPPTTQPPGFDPASVPGVYDGVHPHWSDTLTFSTDGTYARGNGDPGRWRIEGNTLVLEWARWGPERVERVADGVYRRSDGFTITRRRGGGVVVITPPQPPPPPPPVIDVSRVPGTYDAIHHRWRDAMVISPDGTYVRSSGEAGRWRIEGNMLLLEWSGRGTSRLVWVNDGVFRSVGGQFTITRRPEPDRRVRVRRGRPRR